MRKRLITPIPRAGTPDDEGWLDLDRAAVVEVTSEEKEYGIESALCQEKRKVGVRLVRELKRSGYSSINRKSSAASRSSSK